MAVKKEVGERREGHGDTSSLTTPIRKGTFMQVGTVIPLDHVGNTAVSVNVKTKHEGGGEKHA
jgi:hypothetical protein